MAGVSDPHNLDPSRLGEDLSGVPKAMGYEEGSVLSPS